MEHLKFENTQVYNFEGALRGMRNPKNSWHLSDSFFGYCSSDKNMAEQVNKVCSSYCDFEDKEKWQPKIGYLLNNGVQSIGTEFEYRCDLIGAKDMGLAQRLIRGGPEHRKFMRQIQVCVDITAPLYW